MRYVTARIKQNTRDETYRIFVTDVLSVGNKVDKRYYDLAHLADDRPQKIVSAEEIKETMKKKINALGGDE